jgi:hypothetical protein
MSDWRAMLTKPRPWLVWWCQQNVRKDRERAKRVTP